MPLNILADIFYNGLDVLGPYSRPALTQFLPALLILTLVKLYFSGARDPSPDRLLHGKVILLTGATTGIGLSLAHNLATRGAHLILLVRSISDEHTIHLVNTLRETTKNPNIFAEQCDLSSLHSIRLFATKWIDNAPPRRLDMLVLLASTLTPPLCQPATSEDGAEETWQVNYLANFHLLSLLSPALRAQPPDRDVRVIAATCATYSIGDLDLSDPEWVTRGYPTTKPWLAYGASKLALMTFLHSFQRHLNAYPRPDKMPPNVRCFLVEPGVARTPSTRRFLTLGSLWGLLIYLLTYPFWWVVLKSPDAAMQSFLTAITSLDLTRGAVRDEPIFLGECREKKSVNPRVMDIEVGKQLWEVSESRIKELEKRSAIERKKKEMAEKKEKEGKEGPKVEEVVDEQEEEEEKSDLKRRRSGRKTPARTSAREGSAAPAATERLTRSRSKRMAAAGGTAV